MGWKKSPSHSILVAKKGVKAGPSVGSCPPVLMEGKGRMGSKVECIG
ncbi:hypothetical protein MIDIC_200013 [Alphaproteobacteria bacterium]